MEQKHEPCSTTPVEVIKGENRSISQAWITTEAPVFKQDAARYSEHPAEPIRAFSLVTYIVGPLANPMHTHSLTGLHAETTIKHSAVVSRTGASHTHAHTSECMYAHTQTRSLTGVKEDHGLEADVLLSLQLELSHPGCGGYEHIKDLHEALDTAPLFSAEQRHKHN